MKSLSWFFPWKSWLQAVPRWLFPQRIPCATQLWPDGISRRESREVDQVSPKFAGKHTGFRVLPCTLSLCVSYRIRVFQVARRGRWPSKSRPDQTPHQICRQRLLE